MTSALVLLEFQFLVRSCQMEVALRITKLILTFAASRLLAPLLLLSLSIFFLLRAIPGDPIDVFLGGAEKELSFHDKETLRHELGLDKSLPEQYLYWLAEIAHGKLGSSYRDGRPVAKLIGERLPATLALVGFALCLILILGLIWGLCLVTLSWINRFTLLNSILLASAYAIGATPSFYLGFVLIVLVSHSSLKSLPLLALHAAGLNGINLASLLLPGFVLASRRAAKLALFLNASMLVELSKDYVLTAKLKGLSKTNVLIKHVGKNSLGPIVSLLALSLPALFGGSILFEIVFAWPGMGRLAVDATFARNYPILLSLTMIYGTLVILANLAADALQLMLDPRIKDKALSN